MDIVSDLPSEAIRDLVEEQIADFQGKHPKFILDRSPEMSTNYYQFNLMHEVFKDKRVRQAFNYAIDRNKIIDNVLKGEAYGPGHYGISPPSFKGYANTDINGYTANVMKAKILLSQAGYPDGKGFPEIKLELNQGSAQNTKVAFEVQKQLRQVLNINIEMEVLPFATRMENDLYGRAHFARKAWIADYPSPESFLSLFYGKSVPASTEEPSYPNTTRYNNPKFDELYEKGVSSMDPEESYAAFLEAEKIMMEDAPVMVLWYSETYKLIQSYVHSFYSNPMDTWDFSQVYLKNLTTEEPSDKANAETSN